jgi:tRNA(His) 5'-end guanylyltransferase
MEKENIAIVPTPLQDELQKMREGGVEITSVILLTKSVDGKTTHEALVLLDIPKNYQTTFSNTVQQVKVQDYGSFTILPDTDSETYNLLVYNKEIFTERVIRIDQHSSTEADFIRRVAISGSVVEGTTPKIMSMPLKVYLQQEHA